MSEVPRRRRRRVNEESVCRQQDESEVTEKNGTTTEATANTASHEVTTENRQVSYSSPQGVTKESLVRRAELFLEDADWEAAVSYFDKALDIDPEYSRAYIGKVVAHYKMHGRKELSSSIFDFENTNDWKHAIHFASSHEKMEYEQYLASSIEWRRMEKAYEQALGLKKKADALARSQNAIDVYEEAKLFFQDAESYKDAVDQALECCRAIEEIEKELLVAYENAKRMVLDGPRDQTKCLEVAYQFEKLGTYKDSEKRAKHWRNKAKECADLEKRKMKRRKALTNSVVILCIICIIVYVVVITPIMRYKEADQLSKNGSYEEAKSLFVLLAKVNYKDAAERIKEQDYLHAEQYLANGDSFAAIELFEKAIGYKNADERVNELHYNNAEILIENQAFIKAADEFALAGTYKDAQERIKQAYYLQAEKLVAANDAHNAIGFYKKAGDYKNTTERLSAAYYAEGDRLIQEQKYSEAYSAFLNAGDYLDAKTRADSINKNNLTPKSTPKPAEKTVSSYSNRCAECGTSIASDAMFCMKCIVDAVEQAIPASRKCDNGCGRSATKILNVTQPSGETAYFYLCSSDYSSLKSYFKSKQGWRAE